jgi:ABC-type nickel/cobalt efflux system permease component RcnA
MPDLPEGAVTALRFGAALCGAATALLIFSLAVWTARDISARTRDKLIRISSVLLVMLVPLVGLIVYLLLRPRDTIAERYERELVEEILTREVSAAAIQRNQERLAAREGRPAEATAPRT